MTPEAVSSARTGVSPCSQVPQHRAAALIDRQALRHNAGIVRRLAGNARVCAVVKADAYGHGVELVVPALSDQVDSFAVATLEEGAAVRGLAPTHDVLVLSEFNHPAQVSMYREQRLQPVIHHTDQARWLVGQGGIATQCWIKVDSGMHRLGIRPEELDDVRRLVAQACDGEPGLMSHFACADSPDSPMNADQLAMFKALPGSRSALRSMANSAALAGLPEARFDMVRAGLLLYGVTPFNMAGGGPGGLRPAMRFQARVIAVKTLPAGGYIGYGATWRAKSDRQIAILAAGYADGYPRRLGNIAHVLANGKAANVIGMVSMDTMAIDATHCGPLPVGENVELWGETLRVETVARWADTIPYELLSQVTGRVKRVGRDG